MYPPLLAIVGPTAVGKTTLSLRLAEMFQGEVISADSRLVYRGMNIGTAKPGPQEMASVPHHLINVTTPDAPLTLAQYQTRARAAIDNVASRTRLPMLVGGSGLYVRAVLEGWTIPQVPPNAELRAVLREEAERKDGVDLHRWLSTLDPVAASGIDGRNTRRVIRALEVCLVTGQPVSRLQKKRHPPFRILRIGLTMPREILYLRIDRRVDQMMEDGLVEEVQELVAKGYGFDLPAMSGLGYRQIGLYLCGEATLEEAVALIKRETRRFVRQQYTWFRLTDPGIRWFDAHRDGYVDEVNQAVREFLQTS